MKISKVISRSLSALILAAATVSAPAAEFGQWSAAVDGNWNDGSKWTGGSPDGVDAFADFSVSGSTPYTVTLNDTVTVGTITNSVADPIAPLNIVGSGTLVMSTSGTAAGAFSGKDTTIGVTIAGTKGFNVTSGAAWTGTSQVYRPSLTLSGSNTYSGTTYVDKGLLLITHNNALGAGGDANRTYVGFNQNNDAGLALANGVNVADETVYLGRGYGQTPGTLYVMGENATATWGGKIEIGKAQPNIGAGNHAGNVLNITGNIVVGALGVQTLQITGLGTVFFSGTASYTGETQIRMGTLKLGGHNRLNPVGSIGLGLSGNTAIVDLNGYNQTISRIFKGSGAGGDALRRQITNANLGARSGITINGSSDSGEIVFSGNLDLIKAGTGALTVDAASSYTGDTYVKVGTLTLGGLKLHDESDVFIDEGAILAWKSGVTGTDTIRALHYDGIQLALGKYGAIGMAGVDYQVDFLSGNASLLVTIPEPGTVGITLGAAGMLLFVRRLRSKRHI